eukprot:Sspe_Gene.92537::Locus_64932_Transcript_1_1_Confidence_1.000_Length_510::g.92537::m.92537
MVSSILLSPWFWGGFSLLCSFAGFVGGCLTDTGDTPLELPKVISIGALFGAMGGGFILWFSRTVAKEAAMAKRDDGMDADPDESKMYPGSVQYIAMLTLGWMALTFCVGHAIATLSNDSAPTLADDWYMNTL